jgi:hypothetical protein
MACSCAHMGRPPTPCTDGARPWISERAGGLDRRGLGGHRGDQHQEETEEKRPQRDPIGARGNLRLSRRGPAPGRRIRVPGDGHRPPLSGRIGLHHAESRPYDFLWFIVPQLAGTGVFHRAALFLVPAGLADGLAQKELCTTPRRSTAIRPRSCDLLVPPRPFWGLGWMEAACYQRTGLAGRNRLRKLRGRSYLPATLATYAPTSRASVPRSRFLGMRFWPVPPSLIALVMRWGVTCPSSSRSGPVTPRAFTAFRS